MFLPAEVNPTVCLWDVAKTQCEDIKKLFFWACFIIVCMKIDVDDRHDCLFKPGELRLWLGCQEML